MHICVQIVISAIAQGDFGQALSGSAIVTFNAA